MFSGLAAKVFMRGIVMENIDDLILNPQMNINAIMWECGFRHSQTFTMYFRRLKSCTPAEFRKLAGLASTRGRSSTSIKASYLTEGKSAG